VCAENDPRPEISFFLRVTRRFFHEVSLKAVHSCRFLNLLEPSMNGRPPLLTPRPPGTKFSSFPIRPPFCFPDATSSLPPPMITIPPLRDSLEIFGLKLQYLSIVVRFLPLFALYFMMTSILRTYLSPPAGSIRGLRLSFSVTALPLPTFLTHYRENIRSSD